MGRLVTYMARLNMKGLGVNAGTAVAVECEGPLEGQAQVFGTFAYFLSNEGAQYNWLNVGSPLDYRNVRVRRIAGGTWFNFQAAWGAGGGFGDVYYVDAVSGMLVPHPGYGMVY